MNSFNSPSISDFLSHQFARIILSCPQVSGPMSTAATLRTAAATVAQVRDREKALTMTSQQQLRRVRLKHLVAT